MQKFRVIVADPPWPFKDTLKMSDVKRSAEANYNVMTITDIRQLPIQNFTRSDGTILALWVPGSLLLEGMNTMRDWGFQQKQVYVWVKNKKNWKGIQNCLAFGMGRLFRQTHELCLIGTSNNKVYQKLKNKSQRSVCLAPNLKHSAKPDNLQESLEVMFPRGKKLELFARRHRDGWTCLGDEICNGEDIRVSLSKLT